MDQKFIEYCVKNKIIGLDVLNILLKDASIETDFYSRLVEFGALSQKKLAVSAGEYYKTSVVYLSKIKPDSKALATCSADICRNLNFFPIALESNGTLHVAVADYSIIDRIQTVLQTNHNITKFKYYIAPHNSLNEMLNGFYGVPAPDDSSMNRRRVSARTQTRRGDFSYTDLSPLTNETDEDLSSTNPLQELAACRKENQNLSMQLNRLAAVMELDSSLLRGLAQTLAEEGVVDSTTTDHWLNSNR